MEPNKIPLGNVAQGYNAQPQEVAVDNSGNIYIAHSNTVEKFNSSGNYLMTFSTHGSQTKGVAVDSSGNVTVAGNLTVEGTFSQPNQALAGAVDLSAALNELDNAGITFS